MSEFRWLTEREEGEGEHERAFWRSAEGSPEVSSWFLISAHVQRNYPNIQGQKNHQNEWVEEPQGSQSDGSISSSHLPEVSKPQNKQGIHSVISWLLPE